MEMKEYRVVGLYGQWGEILPDPDAAERDRAYAQQAHKHAFHVEERDVSEWRKI